MSQDKELEIQLQFLDEAQEYLGTLETALLGLASNGVDIDRINAALRAAHSIKGGAGMMGFQTLSSMAHQLEDSFKVLKVQRHSLEVDADLEGLLLTSVDCLRQAIDGIREAFQQGDRSDNLLNPHWLKIHADPIFEELHNRLGDPEAEDANSILSPEEGQDVIPLLFQTEVEGCLVRMESVIETQSPCLREEVDILAQELGGLGEMLQMPAFVELCHSVAQHITVAPDQYVEEVAQLALQAWRRSQALVLTGNLELLPRAIEGASFVIPEVSPVQPELDDSAAFLTDTGWSDTDWSDTGWSEELTEAGMTESITESWLDALQSFSDLPAEALDEPAAAEPVADEPVADEPTISEPATDAFAIGEPAADEPIISEPAADEPASPLQTNSSAQTEGFETITVQSIHSVADKATPAAQTRDLRDVNAGKEAQENSVRVPVKQLDQLSDLFGELTIERNGLDLHLKRMRSLVQTLNKRVQILEHSNAQLRNSYDKVSIRSDYGLPLLDVGDRAAQKHLLNDRTQAIAAQTQNGHLGGFDSLEMDRYNDQHLMSQEVMETIVQIQEVSIDIELGLEDTEQTARELNKTSRQLRTKLTQVRMRPLSDVTDRFPRAIRELSLQHNKPVQIQIYGANTLVDRNILEALGDPLMHLLRNAFDHGIEDVQTRSDRGKPSQGLIEIRVTHRNNRTIITLRDDGGGIPLDKVRAKARHMGLDETLLAAASDEELLSLIFEPGFSTSDKVTALSGRGVGMDVVRDRLRQIQGEVKVDTQPGIGTTFTLSMPFTLSVARVLIAESHGMLMAFPIESIEEMLMLPPEQVIVTANTEAFTWEGTMVQLIRLSQWLEFRRAYQPEGLETQASIGVPTVLLLAQGSHLVGLQIDRSWGEQEVAIRKVEGGLPMPAGFSNCTILGDGRVVPLVNVPEMLHWIVSCERSQVEPVRPIQNALPSTALSSKSEGYGIDRQPTVLIVDDSINVRRLLALTLERAGYQVAQAKDGQDALDKLGAGLQVQAVICDIEMPRLDGYGFLAKVKSTPPLEHIPIAMLTSRSGDKHRQLAMSLGASAYFSKPYNEQTLLQAIKNLMKLEAVV